MPKNMRGNKKEIRQLDIMKYVCSNREGANNNNRGLNPREKRGTKW